MADNKRWFKGWNSILTDPSFLDLPLEQIGRWTLLGVLISLHGENGKITLSQDSLYRLLRIENDNANDNGLVIPNCMFEHHVGDNGKITVIMKNWAKYQMDSTGYERLKRYREKQNDNGAREDKEKTKKRKELKAEPKPVDNSEPYEAPPPLKTALSQTQKETLATLCETLKSKRRDFNPYAFIGHCLKNNIHPDAQILALQRLSENNKSIPTPWPYCCKIAGVESGNYHERDFQKKRAEEGNLFQDILNKLQGGMK